jgi:hypothetical protein
MVGFKQLYGGHAGVAVETAKLACLHSNGSTSGSSMPAALANTAHHSTW